MSHKTVAARTSLHGLCSSFGETDLLFRGTDEFKRNVNLFIAGAIAGAITFAVVAAVVRPSTCRLVLLRRRSTRIVLPSSVFIHCFKLPGFAVALFQTCHRGNMRRRIENDTAKVQAFVHLVEGGTAGEH